MFSNKNLVFVFVKHVDYS